MRSLYSFVEAIRFADKIPETETDEFLLGLIEAASRYINSVTRCLFYCTESIKYESGKNQELLELSDHIPIQAINSVTLIAARGKYYQGSVYMDNHSDASLVENTDVFVLDNIPFCKRFLEYLNYKWPYGIKNIKIDGAFGWVDNYAKVETETTQDAPTPIDLDGEPYELHVDDVTGFMKYDNVEIIDEVNGKFLNVLLKEVDYSNNILLFEKIMWDLGCKDIGLPTFPTGSKVRRYGTVPEDILRVMVYVTYWIYEQYRIQYNTDWLKRKGPVSSEKTDYYSVRFYNPLEFTGELTGSAEADAVLRKYMPKTQVGVV